MKDYSALPDGMSSAEVAVAFEELLSEATGRQPPPEEQIAEALCEVADRQWHTYGMLRSDLLSSVEQWLQDHWRTDSDDYVANLVCVMTRLGLQSLMQHVQNALLDRCLATFASDCKTCGTKRVATSPIRSAG